MARRRMRQVNAQEINGMINSMMDPNISNEQLFGIMGETARALDMDSGFRRMTAVSKTRQEINTAKATDDIDALRRLANKNLAQKKR